MPARALAFEIVHEPEQLTNVDVDRTLLDAPAATHTGHAAVVLVDKVLELVHEALPHPLQLLVPGIMPGAMVSEERKHTGIPVPDPDPLALAHLILHVEAPARGADKRTNPAVDAGKLYVIPEGRVEEGVQILLS
jgi:hypothetical protein